MNGDGNRSNAQQYVTGVIEDSCLMEDHVVYSRLQWKPACVLPNVFCPPQRDYNTHVAICLPTLKTNQRSDSS